MPARTRPSPLSLRFVGYARLHNHRLSATTCTTPAAVVSGLGAVQAQDYPGAKWALALRMRQATDLAIERAFAAGAILRTHSCVQRGISSPPPTYGGCWRSLLLECARPWPPTTGASDSTLALSNEATGRSPRRSLVA